MKNKKLDPLPRWERSRVYETQPHRTREWLERHFLLPRVPGADEVPDDVIPPNRVIVSTEVDDLEAAAGYSIHGRGVVADVRVIDDRLRLQKLRRTTERDRRRRLRLVQADVVFEDISRVGELRADMRDWIDRLVEGEGFLAMWRDYNRLDARYVRRTVGETGKCRYLGWKRIAGGRYRFTVETGVPSPPSRRRTFAAGAGAQGAGGQRGPGAGGRRTAVRRPAAARRRGRGRYRRRLECDRSAAGAARVQREGAGGRRGQGHDRHRAHAVGRLRAVRRRR